MKDEIKVRYIILLLLFTASSVFSQNNSAIQGSLKGVIADVDSKEGIELATIKLLNPKDSALVVGVSASEIGAFSFGQKFGDYIFEISRLGYHRYYRNISLSSQKPLIDFDTIFLQIDEIFLEEAQIVGQIPAIQVKGDTIEFNADAYNIDRSTVLRDLIKQIPGLEIDKDGNLKANGKAISKILVDGKEYFGNDIGMALSTLPGKMINKLQLFEKESEEAKASGIKDADPEQVLNLDVKQEFKRSVFGDAKSGGGNRGRHVNKFNLNRMYGDNQYSVVGNINNISDYGGYNFGANFDDNISKEVGGNFNIQKSEKLSFNGNATYRNNKTRSESVSDSYSSILNQYSDRRSKSVNRRQGLNTGLTMDWKPDSLTTIFLRTSFSYNEGNNSANSMDSATIVGKSITSTQTDSYSENSGFRTNNSLMISRKLNSKGRNVSINMAQSFNKDNTDGTNLSKKKYWLENTTDVLDQKSKTKNKSQSYNVSFRYVEPIGKDDRLSLSYFVGTNASERTGDVRKLDTITGEHTIIDRDYSRNTESYSLRQNIRLGFQRSKEKYFIFAGFSVDPSYTRNKSYLVDSLIENLKQSVVNYSPTLGLEWKPAKNTSLELHYYGSTSHPDIMQLSGDTIVHSAMSKSVGNPGLKPSFNNNVNLNFRKSDFESGRYLYASLSYSYTFNSVVGYQLVDDNSNAINTYRNIDGNSNANMYVTYNTPLKNKKFTVSGYLGTNYSRTVSFLNEKKKTIDRVSISPSVTGRFNSDKIETNLDFGVSYTIAENSLSDMKRSDNTEYHLSHNLKVKLPLDFSIDSYLRYSYRSGYSKGVKKSETMWNLAASKLFLKDKRGTLKFEFFDVLNDFREQENTVNGSDYSNYWQRRINSYFILSFSYRFNITDKKG